MILSVAVGLSGLLDPFVTVSLGIVVLVNASLFEKESRVMAAAVILGWWGSMVLAQPWGGQSLFLATVVLVMALLRLVFELKQWWVAVIGGMGAQLAWSWVFGEGVSMVVLGIQGLLCVLTYGLWRSIKPPTAVYLQ